MQKKIQKRACEFILKMLLATSIVLIPLYLSMKYDLFGMEYNLYYNVVLFFTGAIFVCLTVSTYNKHKHFIINENTKNKYTSLFGKFIKIASNIDHQKTTNYMLTFPKALAQRKSDNKQNRIEYITELEMHKLLTKSIQTPRSNKNPINITISSDTQAFGKIGGYSVNHDIALLSKTLLTEEFLKEPNHIDFLSIGPLNGSISIILKNIFIQNLILNAPVDVLISNCIINKLTINNGKDVDLSSTQINEFKISQVNSLELSGTTVINNFLADDFKYKVNFTIGRETSIYGNLSEISNNKIQTYRNLLQEILNHNDTVTARKIKAVILKMERQYKDTGVYKWVSIVYDIFSHYGTSPGTCLKWIAMISLISTLFIFTFDGGRASIKCLSNTAYSTNKPDRSLYEETICKKKSLKSRFVRSIALGTKSVVNPLGYSASNIKVEPRFYWLTYPWLFFHWVINATLVTLLIFSLRGRFKLHA